MDSQVKKDNNIIYNNYIKTRYDEEDERMKTIMDGKDPGNLGVKDTSKLASTLTSTGGGNISIQSLCNPFSSLKAPKTENVLQSVSPLPQPPPNIVRE